MGLSLSTSAAPELSLGALDAACRGRGLDGEEIVLAAGADVEAAAREVEACGARVVALRVESLGIRAAPGLAHASGRLGVPVSVPSASVPAAELDQVIAAFEGTKGRLLLSAGTNLEEMAALVDRIRSSGRSATLGVAWDVRPSAESLEDASAVIFTVQEFLGLVRLYGGGPEQRDQEGLGVGGLLADLALARYTGSIVLSPSRPETLPQWSKWLTSKRSAGCGTKSATEIGVITLDMRKVEPRDRLETILGSYKSMARGETMKLTLDHNPSCMYYTLQATEPEGSFSFQTVEHGPVVWRAQVTKL